MDALGLVCESHRSTEVMTLQEMELIRHFLLPNLNSQSPGIRQQTVSLLKKVSLVPSVVIFDTTPSHLIHLKVVTLWSLKCSTLQLLSRMKDSALLLQKRLIQEREQTDQNQHILLLYKVHHTWTTTTQRSAQVLLFSELEGLVCVCVCVIVM